VLHSRASRNMKDPIPCLLPTAEGFARIGVGMLGRSEATQPNRLGGLLLAGPKGAQRWKKRS